MWVWCRCQNYEEREVCPLDSVWIKEKFDDKSHFNDTSNDDSIKFLVDKCLNEGYHIEKATKTCKFSVVRFHG